MTYLALLGTSDLAGRIREIAKKLFSNGNQHLYRRLEIALALGNDSDLNELLRPIAIKHITGTMHSSISALTALGYSAELQSPYPDEEIKAALENWAQSKRPKPVEIKPLPPMNAPALLVRGDAITDTLPKPEQPKSLKSLGSTQMRAQPDPQRRLARLRELGGDALFKHGNWQITGIAALVKAEASEGRKRSSEKTIRDDLRAAAELERQEQREGRLFSGLGAR